MKELFGDNIIFLDLYWIISLSFFSTKEYFNPAFLEYSIAEKYFILLNEFTSIVTKSPSYPNDVLIKIVNSNIMNNGSVLFFIVIK